MTAYKAFNKDLTCLNYKFKENEPNYTDKANCRENGFHCAENPLDCLSYYRFDNCVIYEVDATGDVDEDDIDSKISCTVLTLRKKLDVFDFVKAAAKYIMLHPYREQNRHVHNDMACGKEGDKFLIVRGKTMAVSAQKDTIVCMLKETSYSKEILWYSIFKVDGKSMLAGVPYNEYGEIVTEAEMEALHEIKRTE